MALLGPIMLLIGFSITGAVVVGKILLSQQTISRSLKEQQQASADAVNKLTVRVAQLQHTNDWQAQLSLTEREDVTSYSKNIVREATTESFTLRVRGASEDGAVQRHIEASYIRFPRLINLPPAPLMVQGELSPSTSLMLHSITADTLTPQWLSYVSDSHLDLSGNDKITCLEPRFNVASCVDNAVTSSAVKGPDIVDNAAGFPPDIFAYLFGVTSSRYEKVRQSAHFLRTNCDDTTGLVGMIWIEGNCDLATSAMLGSETSPVIVVVHNGELLLRTHSKIFGLVVIFRENSALDYRVTIPISALVKGAIISNHAVDADSTINILYSRALLLTLQRHPFLQQMELIPGTWRSF